ERSTAPHKKKTRATWPRRAPPTGHGAVPRWRPPATTGIANKGKLARAAPATAEAAIPEVLGGVAPYLFLSGATKAADFYKRAFGAKEVYRHPVDDKGRTMHIHLVINGGSVMLSDFYPEHGFAEKPPQAFNLHIHVADAD